MRLLGGPIHALFLPTPFLALDFVVEVGEKRQNVGFTKETTVLDVKSLMFLALWGDFVDPKGRRGSTNRLHFAPEGASNCSYANVPGPAVLSGVLPVIVVATSMVETD